MSSQAKSFEFGNPDKTIPEGLPRSFDLVVSMVGLIVTFPVLILCAALVALTSSGGVLFRQQRVGRNGKSFTLYKLRTMKCSGAGPEITKCTDSRVTPIGRVLRKAKLDELPTLWNVVKGDMSLVGPRPEVPRYIDFTNNAWQVVLSARPGLTDPVTLQLRNEEELLAAVGSDAEEYYVSELLPLKIQGNISYLRTRSYAGDLKVLTRTLITVLFPFEAPPPRVHGNQFGELGRPHSSLKLMPKWERLTLDLLILIAAFGLSYLMRFDFLIPRNEWSALTLQLMLVIPLQLFALHATGVYRFVGRYIGLREMRVFAKAAILSVVLLILLRLFLPQSFSALRVPVSVIIMDGVLAFGGTAMIRVLRRVFYERYKKLEIDTHALAGRKESVLLIGAGRNGLLTAREIQGRGDLDLEIVGFIDDAPEKQHMVIQGIEVKGTTSDLPRLVKDLGIDQVILTMASAPGRQLKRIVGLCDDCGIRVRIVPGLSEILDGRAETLRIHESMSDRL